MKIHLKLKKRLKDFIIQCKFWLRLRGVDSSKPRIFYMMGLGDRFPNLGDQAQAAAIPIWINKHFSMPIIQVKNDAVHQCLPIIEKCIQNHDIVFMHSGGNFGDDWYNTQLDREAIVSRLSNNTIVQLPQTIFYSDTVSGNVALKNSQHIIGNHPSMLIYARDLYSSQLAKTVFANNTIHARPDMVLSLHAMVTRDLELNKTVATAKFSRVLLILRNDKEGVYDEGIKRTLSDSLTYEGYESTLWDTDVDDVFPETRKYEVLLKYLRFIASFDAVITDRYHGLIFSVLVNKPCVVLKTHNHKLTSAFDWFDEVNFTRRANQISDIPDMLKELERLHEYVSPDWNSKHFDPMAREVQAFLSQNNRLQDY